jgi:PAS domain S-box-containing protein
MHLPHQGSSNTADVDLDVLHAATLLDTATVQTTIPRRQREARVDALGIITTPQENITYLHDKLRAASSPCREELTGQDHRGLSTGHANDCFCDLWTSIAQGKVWKGEIRNRATDGRLFWVDSTIIPFLADDGSPQYVVIRAEICGRESSAADATTLNRRLLEQQSYTHALVGSDTDALMAIDAGGVITAVNSKMAQFTGRTRDELIGAPFKHRVSDPARAQTSFNRLPTDSTLGNREPDGRSTHYALHVASYNGSNSHDRDGVLQAVLAAARDVTEQKCYADALQRKTMELEAANRMKSEFLTNMSHELRTRLNSIMGFSEILKDGLVGAMTDRQRERAMAILESGRHMLSLADDIHDLAKVETGNMTLALEAVDLALVCARSVSIIRERAESRHIRLEIDAAMELGSIRADRRKCEQILLNLLSNAIKFTHDGGKVTLRLRRACRAQIGRASGCWTRRGFALADNGFEDFLEISVTDSGIGISADSMNLLFEPFSQIDSGAGRRVDGTGLGLANVKLLADLHGGSVAVESALGEGSRFAVWLPLRAANEGVPASASPMARPRIEAVVRPRIALVVEDDPRSAERIGVQLAAVGFTVLHAAAGEQRIRAAGSKGYLARPIRYREFLPSIASELVAHESGSRRG